MAPNKAAKKSLKKTAKASKKKFAQGKAAKEITALKKASKKRPRNSGEGKDLRRTYEHLHRVSLLHERLEPDPKQYVDALSRAAQAAIAADQPGSAADLLRAAEHLAFASLASITGDKQSNETLVAAARAQYQNLVDRASDDWENHDETAEAELASIFHHLLSAAEDAYANSALFRALEFARGAEALAHSKPAKQRKLTADKVKAAQQILA